MDLNPYNGGRPIRTTTHRRLARTAQGRHSEIGLRGLAPTVRSLCQAHIPTLPHQCFWTTFIYIVIIYENENIVKSFKKYFDKAGERLYKKGQRVV
jgi:hypothetical protein